MVRWFFADPGAAQCPSPHWFGSKIWDEHRGISPPVVGDLEGRRPAWADAGNTLGYLGLEACGSPETWHQLGWMTPPYPLFLTDSRGVAPCCVLGDVVAAGGLGVGGSALFFAALPPQTVVATLEGVAYTNIEPPLYQSAIAAMHGQAYLVVAWATGYLTGAYMEGQAAVNASLAYSVSAGMHGQAVTNVDMGVAVIVAWADVEVIGTTPSIVGAANISSVSRTGIGQYDLYFASGITPPYAIAASASGNIIGGGPLIPSTAPSGPVLVGVYFYDITGALADPTEFTVAIIQ
jgi:hypothetical protein